MRALRLHTFLFRLAFALVALHAAGPALQSQAPSGGGYGTLARRASARPITLAGPVEGRLTARDPAFNDGSYFHVWKFSGRGGQDVAISLSSREFGAFLMLVAAEGTGEQPLQMAIADTATKAAQLAFRVPLDGDYLIVANTQESRATGRYELSLRSLSDACAAGGPCAIAGTVGGITPVSRINVTTAPPLALGATRNAELTANDAQLGDSSRFNAWRFDGQAGQRIVIDQVSSEFDTYLLLARQTPTGPVVYRENDDAPSVGAEASENSQIAVELPETGSYLIIATSFRPSTTGRYELRVRSMQEACAAGGPCTPMAAPAPRTFFGNVMTATSAPIALGDTVRARLTARDRSIGDGTRFKSYRFRGNANDEIAIFLEARTPDATRFDPYLHLLQQVGDTLASLKSDDDGGGQRNALVTARLPVTGEYFIVANGLTVADTGNFSLAVLRLADACSSRNVCAVGADLRNVTTEVALRSASAERIAIGDSVSGSFHSGSSRLPDGKAFAAYRFAADSGERVVITNRSVDFDAYLYIYAVRDSVVEIARDDDGAGGLDAQLATEFPAAGEYLIVAGSFDANARGEYRLSLETMDAACAAGGACVPGATVAYTARLLPALAAAQRDLPARGVLRGEIAQSAPRLAGGGRFQSYRFRGRAGERIVISMESTSLDPYLHLALIRGSGLRFVARDDDGGSGTDARLVATLPETGEYLVVASGLDHSDSTGFGAYSISRARCDDACAAYRDIPGTRSTAVYGPILAAERRPVPPSGLAEDELGATDSTLTDGTAFHAYWMEARQGATVRAALHSRKFDPFLALMRVERNTLVMVAADDDGGPGTDALLEWPVDRAGTYVVVVTAFSRDSLGAYALNIEQGSASAGEEFLRRATTSVLRPQLEQALAAPSQPLIPGREISAQLAVGAPELSGRGRFRAYRFTGRANERAVITMASRQFDTYLYLAQVVGGTARFVAMDDDGADGTDSRIAVNLPADGEYLVIAAAFDTAGRGNRASFRIKLETVASSGALPENSEDAYVPPALHHNSEESYDHGAQAVRSLLARRDWPRRLRGQGSSARVEVPADCGGERGR